MMPRTERAPRYRRHRRGRLSAPPATRRRAALLLGRPRPGGGGLRDHAAPHRGRPAPRVPAPEEAPRSARRARSSRTRSTSFARPSSWCGSPAGMCWGADERCARTSRSPAYRPIRGRSGNREARDTPMSHIAFARAERTSRSRRTTSSSGAARGARRRPSRSRAAARRSRSSRRARGATRPTTLRRSTARCATWSMPGARPSRAGARSGRSIQASLVGGTTVINSAIGVRTPADIFEQWQREHGVGGAAMAERSGACRTTSSASSRWEEVTGPPRAAARTSSPYQGGDALGFESHYMRAT